MSEPDEADAEEKGPAKDEADAEEKGPVKDDAAPATTPTAETAAETGAPKAKKKKRKPEAAAPPIDDPRVREIEVMFGAGDFVRTKEIADELVAASDPRLVDVGRDYLYRIGVDPVQLAFLGLCAAALIAIAWIYIPH